MRLFHIALALVLLTSLASATVEIAVTQTNCDESFLSTGISDGGTGSRDVTSAGPTTSDYSGGWHYEFDFGGNAIVSTFSPTLTTLPSPTYLELTDDSLSDPIHLPFGVRMFSRLNYYVTISSNGIVYVSHGLPYSTSSGCCSGQSMATQYVTQGTDYLVAGTWNDLYPQPNGYYAYDIIGTAPNRVFIVQYYNISNFNDDDGGYFSEIRFFESTYEPGYGYGYGYEEDDNGDKEKKDMSLSFESDCDDNVVTVTSGGDPVKDVKVTVIDVNNGPLFSGDTDSDGEVTFSGCGLTVNIFASKNGYHKESITRTLISCGQCEEEEEPVPETHLECVNKACVAVSGAGADKCSSEKDCAPPPEVPPTVPEPDHDCEDDSDCLDAEYCDIEAGALGGDCIAVTGCGSVANHTLDPYECGDAPGCPSCPEGKICKDNKCVESDITGPGSGIVGDSVEVKATEGNDTCRLCDVEIIDPDGNKQSGQTDDDGTLDIPLNKKGTYNVTLLKDGVPVKSILINAMPKLPSEEPEKPTVTGDDPFTLLFILIIIAIFIGGLIYVRSRKRTKLGKGGK